MRRDKRIMFNKKLKFHDLIGKTLLVGITYYTKNGDLIERKQFYGKVVFADTSGITLLQDSGEKLELPPDLSSTKKAPRGEYRLHSTGETVKDPDFLSTWELYKSDK